MDEIYDKLFSERLTSLIKNSNCSLNEIEECVGKRAATISRYASGEITGVKRSTIVKLAHFFQVSPAWLAGLSDEKYIASQNDIEKTNVLLYYYNKLNESGKEKILDNIKDLSEMTKYTEKSDKSQDA